MLIAPFLGEMVGDELDKKNSTLELWHANDTRVTGSDTPPTRIKGCRSDTP